MLFIKISRYPKGIYWVDKGLKIKSKFETHSKIENNNILMLFIKIPKHPKRDILHPGWIKTESKFETLHIQKFKQITILIQYIEISIAETVLAIDLWVPFFNLLEFTSYQANHHSWTHFIYIVVPWKGNIRSNRGNMRLLLIQTHYINPSFPIVREWSRRSLPKHLFVVLLIDTWLVLKIWKLSLKSAHIIFLKNRWQI